VSDDTNFADWLEFGASRGWVSLPVCDTHTGVPLMPEEELDFEDGFDPCIVVMRVWAENILAEYEDGI
jgi:hypothetical protein